VSAATDIFDDPVKRENKDKMDAAIEDIRRRYGKRAVYGRRFNYMDRGVLDD
jgi:hypothetical protein